VRIDRDDDCPRTLSSRVPAAAARADPNEIPLIAYYD
jgi:hypothetical protein